MRGSMRGSTRGSTRGRIEVTSLGKVGLIVLEFGDQ